MEKKKMGVGAKGRAAKGSRSEDSASVSEMRCEKCGRRGASEELSACAHVLCLACLRATLVEQLGAAFPGEQAAMRAEEPGRRAYREAPPIVCPLLNCTALIPFHRASEVLLAMWGPAAAPRVAFAALSEWAVTVTAFDAAGAAHDLRLKLDHKSRLSQLLGAIGDAMGADADAIRRGRLFVSHGERRRLKRANSEEWRAGPTANAPWPSTPAQCDSPTADDDEPFSDLAQHRALNSKVRKLPGQPQSFLFDLSGRFNPAKTLPDQTAGQADAPDKPLRLIAQH